MFPPSLSAQGKDGSDLGGVTRPHHSGSVPLEAAGPVGSKASRRIAGQNVRSAHHCSDGAQRPGREYSLHRPTRRQVWMRGSASSLARTTDRRSASAHGQRTTAHQVAQSRHDYPGQAAARNTLSYHGQGRAPRAQHMTGTILGRAIWPASNRELCRRDSGRDLVTASNLSLRMAHTAPPLCVRTCLTSIKHAIRYKHDSTYISAVIVVS